MTRFQPRPRKEYIREQKEKYGRSIFGVFPAQYPKEIFWAMNALPVEIWDPPLEISRANAHLQPYICSVVRLGLELILQGHCDDVDGFLFPHTCDSIQNLASIVNDYLRLKKPCYFFYHPKAPYRPSSRDYYLKQLKDLASGLEKQLGPLNLDELKRRVRQSQEMFSLIKDIYERRAKGKLQGSNEEFYRVLRQGEFLHPNDFLPLLSEFAEASRGEAKSGPVVIMSGVLPNPPEILSLLDELGVRIGEDDLLNCSRRLLVHPSGGEDPCDPGDGHGIEPGSERADENEGGSVCGNDQLGTVQGARYKARGTRYKVQGAQYPSQLEFTAHPGPCTLHLVP